MQITGGVDWREPDEGVGTGMFGHREELEAFGCMPTRGGTSACERRSADFVPDREMYFDMDIALPFHWETITGIGHKLSKSTDSQDFEFNMSGNPGEPVDREISPADELFFKGQLLPLHLPKRLQMVQKLSTPKQSSPSSSRDKGDASGVSVSCFFQPSSLKYSPLGMDESYLGSALVNSRSSSFHSQGSNNFWESDSPRDVDTGDSSSSRDSSGSSQDACVPDKQSQRVASLEDHMAYSSKDRAFFQQREFFNNHNLRAEKSLFSSWLRSPFKWKVLFGLRRNSKSRSDGSSKEMAEEPNNNRRASHSHDNPNKKKLPREAASPLEDLPSLSFSRSSRPSTAHSFSSEQKLSSRKEVFSSSSSALSDLPHRGLFLFPPSDGGGVAAASGKEKEKLESSERSVSASKTRENLQKYLSILKPINGKATQRSADTSDLSSSCRVVDIRATTFSGNLTTSPKHATLSSASLPSPKTSFSKSMSSPKPSFSEKRSSGMHSLSGNLRVPSFSRSSKASINAGNAARASSPNHSGVLPTSNPSSMAELHSAIQGAIAHCKQSQAAKADCK